MTESRPTRLLLGGFCLAALAGSVVYIPAGVGFPQLLAWLNIAALVLGFASVLGLLARAFPPQNLATICAIIGVLAWIEARIPGSAVPGTCGAIALLGLSLVWIVVLLTSRFMARLIFSGSRGRDAYGIRVWVLTAILATHLMIGIAAVASTLNLAAGSGLPGGFVLLRWALTALIMLVYTAPWLIPKRPIAPVENLDPIAVWLGANLLCGSAAIHVHDWRRAAVILAGAALATAIAMVGFKSPP